MDFAKGILLVVAGGALEGLFTIGIKRTPTWKWENTWALGSFVALTLIPWPVAFLTVPDLLGVYAKEPADAVVSLLFGLGWGVGGIFWGLGIEAVGLALGVSLLMGMISVFGSAGPLLYNNPGVFLQPGGKVLLAGLGVMILGVIVCSVAGKRREADLAGDAGGVSQVASGVARPFAIGLLFCVISGVLSPMVNFAFVFGDDLKAAAMSAGAGESSAPNAIWALVFTGNYLVNTTYGVWLLVRNRSAGLYVQERKPAYWLWALFLGTAWPLGIVLYGIGAGKLGTFGAYAGFPMMLLFAILFSNLAGAMIGEWRGTRPQTRRTMVRGVLILFSAAVLFAAANRLMADKTRYIPDEPVEEYLV